jgi:hypothetical protein
LNRENACWTSRLFCGLAAKPKHAIQHLDSLRQSLRQLQKVGGEAVRGMTSAFSTAVDPTTGRHCRAPGNPSFFARDFIAKMVGRQRMGLSSRASPSPQADRQLAPAGFKHDGLQLWPRGVS